MQSLKSSSLLYIEQSCEQVTLLHQRIFWTDCVKKNLFGRSGGVLYVIGSVLPPNPGVWGYVIDIGSVLQVSEVVLFHIGSVLQVSEVVLLTLALCYRCLKLCY